MIPEVRVSRLRAWREVLRTCNPPEGTRVDAVTRWLVVTRACVQPMTLTSAAIAGLLAVRTPGFDPWLYGLAALGIVVAHAANNMINDLFDLQAGIDTTAYPRALYAPHPVLAGLVTRRGLVAAILAANLMDAAVLVVLFLERGWPVVALALAGLFVSLFYVAPPLRLKNRGLGEPSVFLVWGPLMVGGTYYAAVGRLPAEVVWASVPYALLVTSVLVGKHLDKAQWDRELGVHTLPVLLGERVARWLNRALMAGFYAAVAALVATSVLPVWTVAVGGALPMLVRRVWPVHGHPRPPGPPAGYPVWPLWYVAWSFLHARRAGALLVLGLAVGAIRPVTL